MYPSTTAEYSNYLSTNPYSYTMTEEEYYEEKTELENRDIIEIIEDKFFECLENLLPKEYIKVSHLIELAYLTTKCKISFYLNNPKTAAVVSACAIVVFFCPQSKVSFSDLSCVLAFIGYTHLSNRP